MVGANLIGARELSRSRAHKRVLQVLGAVMAIIALLTVAPLANAQKSTSIDQAATILQDSLKNRGYFTPRDASLSNIKFFCACGPYRTCEHESRLLAERLGYELPQYNYVKGAAELRQKILFFLEHGQVVAIEIPYRRPFYFTVEHEAFCDVNLDKRMPRSEEERDDD